MTLPSTLDELAEKAEAFLLDWAEKEKPRQKLFWQIWRLKELAYKPVEEFPNLAERFRRFEEWLSRDGLALSESPLTQFQIEEILAALAKLKLLLPRTAEAGSVPAGRLNELAEQFVRKLSGSQNVPAEAALNTGGSSSPPAAPAKDAAESFKSFLRYQLNYMEQIARPQEHLFSVAGRLLDALAARYGAVDEVFIAHLLYFMQAQNYPVGPYLERFRQIKRLALSKKE
jgi:hypothetical protein